MGNSQSAIRYYQLLNEDTCPNDKRIRELCAKLVAAQLKSKDPLDVPLLPDEERVLIAKRLLTENHNVPQPLQLTRSDCARGSTVPSTKGKAILDEDSGLESCYEDCSCEQGRTYSLGTLQESKEIKGEVEVLGRKSSVFEPLGWREITSVPLGSMSNFTAGVNLKNVGGNLATHNTKSVFAVKVNEGTPGISLLRDGTERYALILAQKPDYVEKTLASAAPLHFRRSAAATPLPEAGLQTGFLFAGAVFGGYLLKQCLRRYRSWQKPRRDSSGFPAGFSYRLPEP